MVVINIDDSYLQLLVNALDSYIHHYDEYQGDMNDVVKAANLSMKIQDRRKQAVDSSATPDEKDEEEYDPNMDPDAKMPGHHFVMGRGWVKN